MKPSDDLRNIAEELKALQQRLAEHGRTLSEEGNQPWQQELAHKLGRYSNGIGAAAKGLARESDKIAGGDYKKPPNKP